LIDPRVAERRRRKRSTFVSAVVFVGLGLLLIWFTKAVVGVTSDGLFVAELFVAILVFLVLSGQISELTAGGVTAKFKELANEPVSHKAAMIDLEEAYFIEKGPLGELEQLRRQVGERRPVVLTLRLTDRIREPQASRYEADAVLQYLNVLAGFERFRLVVFIASDHWLVGYMHQTELARALEDPYLAHSAHALLRAIEMGDEATVRSFPGVVTTALTTGTLNAEALDRLTDLNLEAMIVVDTAGKPVGVVERERLTSQMLAAIARG
jgi:hypothetical protein